jgi:hypothetical protein
LWGELTSGDRGLHASGEEKDDCTPEQSLFYETCILSPFFRCSLCSKDRTKNRKNERENLLPASIRSLDRETASNWT